ncbi:thiamine phosphate synthase [Devosia psychrophila]|uniref:Thiamine-phosphate synthase n=1 Tax=Devosia psychrophila TaxID=728005 RepID=A0A0F5Q1Y7_9HYPH|nr:thiamine phosphate synthase [Devosia psychrophila]KKC34069.1 thiamine-phosphate pyrophosphorylase [Devosia psychrophila]SFD31232.1 thiamine-phosphate pyrophosphorylase [Devosia psychrophila]
MTLDRFYPVVPDADWVERLLAWGARLIQLRIKGCPEPALRAQIERARDACAAAAAQLVVNDHWQLALDIGCDFVHLGQEDLAEADLAALRRAGIRIGISTHDHAELDRALAKAPEYVALGPIYPTQLKQMPWAPQGLARIAEWKRLAGARPLVAIGGLTVARAELCLAAGADCVAVVSDIVRHPDPSGQTRAWLAATRP